MNQTIRLACLVAACVASAASMAQSTAASAGTPRSRADVKAETRAAIAKGNLPEGDDVYDEGASSPKAARKPKKPRTARPAASAAK